MSCYHVSVRQLDMKACVGQRLNHYAFKLNDIILLCQNNPSSLTHCDRLKAFFHFG